MASPSKTSEVNNANNAAKPRLPISTVRVAGRLPRYFNWLLKVAYICIDNNEDIKRFDNELLHEYYSNGLTPYEAFKELLSEMPYEISD